jgi:hypothetical protein
MLALMIGTPGPEPSGSPVQVDRLTPIPFDLLPARLQGSDSILPDILIGLALAVVGWLVARRLLTPRVLFSPQALLPGRRAAESQGVRIKIKNTSCFREINSLQLTARFRIRGLVPSRPNTWQIIDLPVRPPNVPRLTPRANRIVMVTCDGMEKRFYKLLKEHNPVPKRCNIAVTDLFKLGYKSELLLAIQCTDGWTGTTVLRTYMYRNSDLVRGVFKVRESRIGKAGRHVWRQVRKLNWPMQRLSYVFNQDVHTQEQDLG